MEIESIKIRNFDFGCYENQECREEAYQNDIVELQEKVNELIEIILLLVNQDKSEMAS